MIRNGEVADQTKLAMFLHVSPSRMSQIMSLLHLTPVGMWETIVNCQQM